MSWLLDTNICVFLIRQKSAIALSRFQAHPPTDILISSLTVAELRYGADKSARPAKNHAAVTAFLTPLTVVDFEITAADYYGTIRSDLERRGVPIGPLDTLIAAHAMSLGVTVVTNNTSEFARVPGLAIEDWSVD